MAYFVYFLESEIDGRLYKGHTNDIDKRIEEHNSGKTKSLKVISHGNWFIFKHLEQERKQYFGKNISKQEFEENF